MTTTPTQVDPGPPGRPARLADQVAVIAVPKFSESFPPTTLVKMAILAGLLVALNHWQFRQLLRSWKNDANWSHGFVIPLFSLFLLYSRRYELLSVRRRACILGLPLMILGILAQILAYHPIGNYWLCQLAMVFVLLSLVLYLGGPAVIRLTWLPILYLILAMPIPDTLYGQIALPLQNFAASGATAILALCGVGIEVTASHLTVTTISGQVRTLDVVEACSGVRSLMAYVALGVAWAYLENRPLWQRLTLVAATVPVAVLCNVLRVTVTCTMFVIDRPELGQKFMHEFTGMLMLVPALALFALLSWMLKNLFVEAEEETPREAPQQSTRGQAR